MPSLENFITNAWCKMPYTWATFTVERRLKEPDLDYSVHNDIYHNFSFPLFLHPVVNCGIPPTLPDGETLQFNTTYNSTVTYKCNSNYTFSEASSERLTCLHSGSWSEEPIAYAWYPYYYCSAFWYDSIPDSLRWSIPLSIHEAILLAYWLFRSCFTPQKNFS